jgi:F0F1-type ATP synthase membrane subunit b/b'
MENLTGQATDLKNQAQSTATAAVGNAQATATAAVGNAQAAASNAVGAATSAVSDLQSKIPQLPKIPNIPKLPGVPEFKTKKLPVPKKFKNSKFKDKLANASAKAKQLAAKGQALAAKGQAAVAGAQAKVQSTIASAQEKAQKIVSDAQDKVNKGIASVEEKATAMAEKAKQSVQNEIKNIQEGNISKPLSGVEKDKLIINKTTELAVTDAKPTQDAAKAALAKSNETIGKPDLSTPMKFIKSYDTPKNGNRFYFYQQRDSVGVYYTSVHDKKDPFSYKIQNFAKKTAESGIDVATRYCNEVEDDA